VLLLPEQSCAPATNFATTAASATCATSTAPAASETPKAQPTPANSAVSLASVDGIGRAAGNPLDLLSAVPDAVRQSLETAGIDDIADIDAIALSEPDAATGLLVARILGVDGEKINRGGSATATGFAGPAEEVRLICDGLTYDSQSPPTRTLLAISTGPGMCATALFRRHHG